MANLSGIISQYGFEFQKKVFIHYLVHKMDVGIKISFELLDDIDYSNEELGGTRFNKTLIQCKTGALQYNVFKHVICNWILSENSEKYLLYLDNKLSFSYDVPTLCTDIKNDIFAYMNNPTKKPRRDCFKFKINYQFNEFGSQNDIDNFNSSIKDIIDKLEVLDNGIEELEMKTKDRFIARFGTNATVDFVKNSRYERFISAINYELTEAILSKKPYTIDYSKYSTICFDIISKITDEHYSIEYFEFKKGKEKIYNSLLSTREAIFLKKINLDDRVIARYLTNELYYKDLRDHYIGIEMDDMIDDIEESANFNYLIEKGKSLSAFETFNNTINKSINDEILLNNEYRQGCYIYLSSDNADDEHFIDWCGENEKD